LSYEKDGEENEEWEGRSGQKMEMLIKHLHFGSIRDWWISAEPVMKIIRNGNNINHALKKYGILSNYRWNYIS
jgi:hypothetical protein